MFLSIWKKIKSCHVIPRSIRWKETDFTAWMRKCDLDCWPCNRHQKCLPHNHASVFNYLSLRILSQFPLGRCWLALWKAPRQRLAPHQSLAPHFWHWYHSKVRIICLHLVYPCSDSWHSQLCSTVLKYDKMSWIHFALLWILTGGSVQSRFHSWTKYSWERLFCSQCTHAQTVFETRHNIKVWHHGNNSRQVSPKKMAIPKIFGCGFPSQVPKLIYHRNCENDTDDRVWNWIDRY